MLKYYQKGSLPFQMDNALGAKIEGLTVYYDCKSTLLDLWVDEERKTAVSKFDGAVTVFCSEQTDYEELKAFLCMIDYHSLFMQKSDFEKIGVPYDTAGSVMHFLGCSEEYERTSLDDKLWELYTLVSEAIPGSFRKDGYLYFLSDYTFRQKRNRARSSGVVKDGKLCACCVTSAECDTKAVVSAVATYAAYRKQGFGKQTVLSLCCELQREGKEVYIFVLNEPARHFYEKIGFECCGYWAQRKVE